MPELPEVEAMTRWLHRWLAGRRLVEIELLDPILLQTDPAGLARLQGRAVQRARRVAKYSLLDLEGGAQLVLHHRMTGKTVQEDRNPGRSRQVRLRLQPDQGPAVILDDRRRLARAWALGPAAVAPFWAAVAPAPEPYPELRDGPWWQARLAGAQGALKPALMDPRRVAGVGNIGATEGLWWAGLHPASSPARLDEGAWQRLAQGMRRWIDDTLSAETAPEIDYFTQGGPSPFQIYGRSGQPCPRCQSPLQSARQSGRASCWCARCQPAPCPGLLGDG